ncbi:mRNA-capping enzyme-like [Diorhabda carinulata]|uniref:mRNA-capping enzyme-like n=1 Tax=Diorhabda carinulata TaxID=1163345 RepID=UPI0025A250D6|nr:mRNA-capping enzyme-like [Diorhabda carinulata]
MGRRNSIPKGWLHCPQNGKRLIADIFMPLKTPLSRRYNVSPKDEYPIQEIFKRAKYNKVHIGLWIDLTNTDRYYNKEDIEHMDCQYVKLSCPGHGECPSKNITNEFISICHQFHNKRPDDCIAVHCTHGYNRTGFLIASYLVVKLNYDVKFAVKEFAYSRPPGIYRENYILELFRRYGKVSKALPPPPLPHWCDR